MMKYFCSSLCVIAVLLAITLAAPSPQHQKSGGQRINNGEDHFDDLEDGASKDDLKTSASHGYGYYGYPFSGYYGGYPYSYGLHGGYYGGYYPYYGGYGFHGHYI